MARMTTQEARQALLDGLANGEISYRELAEAVPYQALEQYRSLKREGVIVSRVFTNPDGTVSHMVRLAGE